jgi:broad specificity phosphatase PhoE
VPFLHGLQCAAVYSSPFARALATVRPYCIEEHLPLVELERLGESTADETLPQVRDRMVGVVSGLADAHPAQTILVCTHGGNLWGLLTAVDASFGYEQYHQLGTPDMRLLHWQGRSGMLDEEFRFTGLPDQ